MIFVFGANERYVMGAGAAKFALENHGAQHGKAGHVGNSYGIPTKDRNIRTLPLDRIKAHVDEFIRYAEANPQLSFNVTKIGCGLANLQEWQIAPMFKEAPWNCKLPEGWRGHSGEPPTGTKK